LRRKNKLKRLSAAILFHSVPASRFRTDFSSEKRSVMSVEKEYRAKNRAGIDFSSVRWYLVFTIQAFSKILFCGVKIGKAKNG